MNYITATISPAIEAQALGIIYRHAKTARAMKADFAAYAERLGSVRENTPTNYTEDLQPIFEELGVSGEHLTEVRRSAAIIGSFMPLTPGFAGVEYRTHDWKLALNDIITKFRGLSTAPETVETKKGRHISEQIEFSQRRETEARGGAGGYGDREQRDVYMGNQRNVYAVDEKVITLFPSVGNRSEITVTIIDDWTETNPMLIQADMSNEIITGYGPWRKMTSVERKIEREERKRRIEEQQRRNMIKRLCDYHSIYESAFSMQQSGLDGEKNLVFSLAKELEVNTVVKSLTLIGIVNNSETIALARSLKINKDVHTLRLTNSSISNDGAIALAELLRANELIRELDLSNNKISQEGALVLEEALKVNEVLQILDLRGNIIGDIEL